VSDDTGTTVNVTDAGGQEADAVRLLDVMASVPLRSTLIAPVQATLCGTGMLMVITAETTALSV
jgi:hypothetical protein